VALRASLDKVCARRLDGEAVGTEEWLRWGRTKELNLSRCRGGLKATDKVRGAFGVARVKTPVLRPGRLAAASAVSVDGASSLVDERCDSECGMGLPGLDRIEAGNG